MNEKAPKIMMEVKNINLRFGGVVAIQGVSFNIHEGEIRAIIGPNGAGKSSMLNVINGFYHPQEGEIWFDGQKDRLWSHMRWQRPALQERFRISHFLKE